MKQPKERQRRRSLEKEFTHEVLSGKKSLPPEASERLLRTLHAEIEARARRERENAIADKQENAVISKQATVPLLQTTWFRWSAAAMLILLAGGLWWHQKSSYKDVASTTPTAGPMGMTLRDNNSDHNIFLSLSDGSTVELSPKSVVRYNTAFEPSHRNIFLSGKAVFSVAADRARPFTVHAGGVRTTALGTRFMVSTLSPDSVQVRLMEGKVVVQPSDQALAMKDVYLLPGQQLLLRRSKGQFAVTTYDDSAGHVAANPARKPSSAVRTTSSHTSILEFNQQPLTTVLNAIGRRYGVVFKLKGDGFNKVLVTGKFLPSDTLPSVLSMLGALNDLSFTEKNDTIVVAATRP
ncbi:MAG: FecR domain-containing protein [Chitinophagaceae bacterium]|nr:FecR domain-containing protein [Chitinophagaceae bacterium]